MDELEKIKKAFKEKNNTLNQYNQSVPTSYFKELENKIMSEVKSEKRNSLGIRNKTVKQYSLWRYASAAAAILVIFFGVSQISNSSLETTEYSEVYNLEETDFLLISDELYTEDFLEIDGIDELLSELEEELNNK